MIEQTAADRSQALEDSQEWIARHLMSMGAGMFRFLATLSTEERLVALGALVTNRQMPPDVAALVMLDPERYAAMAESDPLLVLMGSAIAVAEQDQPETITGSELLAALERAENTGRCPVPDAPQA